MDIAAVSIGMSQAKVAQEAQMSIMKMVMDTAKGEVADLTKMMEVNRDIQRSVLPHLGSNVDIRG